jgi:hypothetical protein
VFRNIKSAKIYREGSLELDSGLMIRPFPVRSCICIATVTMWVGANYRVVAARIAGRVGICWLSTAGLLLGFMLQYVAKVKWGKMRKNVSCVTTNHGLERQNI